MRGHVGQRTRITFAGQNRFAKAGDLNIDSPGEWKDAIIRGKPCRVWQPFKVTRLDTPGTNRIPNPSVLLDLGPDLPEVKVLPDPKDSEAVARQTRAEILHVIRKGLRAYEKRVQRTSLSPGQITFSIKMLTDVYTSFSGGKGRGAGVVDTPVFRPEDLHELEVLEKEEKESPPEQG